MAEEKYYTPNLTELHVGFELEFYNVTQGNVVQHVWHKEVCNQDLLFLAFTTYEHEDYEGEFADTFRVKYLEPQDIKELGWDFAMGSLLGNVHSEPVIFAKYGLIFKFIPKEIHIVISNKEDTIYNGKCYNKSELRWLMERLGINTEK